MIEFIVTIATSIVAFFQVAWALLVDAVGQQPLIAGLVAAALLLIVAIPEIRHHHRNGAAR